MPERNSWAPILHLHPEVLSLIFCHVQDAIAEEWGSHNDPFHKDPFAFQRKFAVEEWMKISHVCHSWREVALNTVSLWSRLAVTNGDYRWAEECLRRSKGSSLVIYVDFAEDENDGELNSQHPSRVLLRELKNHMGRCRDISLQLTTGDLLDFLSQSDTSSLIQFQYFPIPESPAVPISFPLIDDSFLLANSLRRLSISTCPVDWSASIFHRLTHLQLHYIPEENKLECHTFISFLFGMPRLEFVDLCDFLRMANSDANHGKANDGTHLQHLKHVELDDDPHALAGFLSSLPIPPSCKVLINVEGFPNTTAEEYLPILTWASNHFRPPISGSSNASDAHQNYWRSLRIFQLESYFGVQGYSVKENLEQDEILFEHSVRLPDAEDIPVFEIPPNLPQQLFTPLPISRIVYLEISSCQWMFVLSKSMWISIFGSISTLESVCIEAVTLPFFQALHDQDNLGSGSMPFPVLSSVIVQNDEKADFNLILESLRCRFRHGAALKRLVLEDCHEVPPSDLKQLQMVVGEVKVINHYDMIGKDSQPPDGVDVNHDLSMIMSLAQVP